MGEKCSDRFRLRIRLPRNSRDLLHAVDLRHGTDGFTSPPKEGVLKIFSASVGFEPANLGTKGQHATSRPPKPINTTYIEKKYTEKTTCFGYGKSHLQITQSKIQIQPHNIVRHLKRHTDFMRKKVGL